MTCKNCGAEVKDGASFCPHCGAKTDGGGAPEEQAAGGPESGYAPGTGSAGQSQEAAARPGMPNRTKGIIAAAAVVVVIAVILIIVLSTGRTSINLNNYLTVSSSGYDGYGTAEAYIDTAKLEADYGGKLKLTSTGKSSILFNAAVAAGEDPLDLILPDIGGSLSQRSGLSNGDRITYTWDVQDLELYETYINVDLKMNTYEYTVTGLADATKEDVFEGVSVSFSGIAPDGEASVAVDGSKNSWISGSDIGLSRTSGLSNGDTVTASLSDSALSNLLQTYGIAPIETSREFTVSGLPAYITEISQVPEDQFSELEDEVYDAITKAILEESVTDRSINDLSFAGCYLIGNMEGTENELIYVFHINTDDTYNGASHTVDYYSYRGFGDVYISEDGTCHTGEMFKPEYTTDWFWGNYSSGDGFQMDYDGKGVIYTGLETLDDLKESMSARGEILDCTVEGG